ncbi:hypothetical protein [Litchfieldia alkalitelluris]|uniref:hypothetical protein n=1 Tax=Litchfieldia alkalitelluris TaxID=304268 RepID=UPI000995FAB1|nr:hypothetical protein [Litchfieldia alkalitelluris]
MVDVQILRVKDLYEELQVTTIHWLQTYTGKSFETLELLLLDEKVLQMDRTTLNQMFKTMEGVASGVEVTLYSLQSDITERQTFHVEIKQRKSGFSFDMPLHSLLSPEHTENQNVDSYLKYLFIQIAALQFAFEDHQEITSAYIGEILNYFYQNELEMTKEDLPMEFKQDTFRLKSQTEVNTEENEWETSDFAEVKLDVEDDFTFGLDEEDDEEVDEDELDDDLFGAEEEEESTEVASAEFEVEESVSTENTLVIDFASLNQNFNEMYKLAAADDRDQLKSLKADIWEFEMSVEENGLSEDDVNSLAYTILETVGTDAVVMKWQIATAKQLLQLIVK